MSLKDMHQGVEANAVKVGRPSYIYVHIPYNSTGIPLLHAELDAIEGG